MQYKSENETAAMMDTHHISLPNRSSLTEDVQIKRTRKILMIILGVCVALSVIGLIRMIFQSNLNTEGVHTQRGTSVIQVLISILLYGFGLFAAHRYSTLCLRIFAWLLIIGLVLVGIGLGILLIIITALITSKSDSDVHSENIVISATVITIISVFALAVTFIFSIIIVKFAFKLARLIDANKRLIIQPI